MKAQCNRQQNNENQTCCLVSSLKTDRAYRHSHEFVLAGGTLLRPEGPLEAPLAGFGAEIEILRNLKKCIL